MSNERSLPASPCSGRDAVTVGWRRDREQKNAAPRPEMRRCAGRARGRAEVRVDDLWYAIAFLVGVALVLIWLGGRADR